MISNLPGSSRKINSVISWALAAYLFVNCIRLIFDGSFTWTIYGFLILSLVFLPPLYLKDSTALVPFEVLAFLAVPFTLKGLELGFAVSNTLNYLTAAGIALLLVSELDTFTSFNTTPRFSVLLVSITSLGVAGLWAVLRWISDIYFSTGFLVSESSLMWEFTSSLAAGVIAGIVFTLYLSRRDEEVEPLDED